MFDKIRHRRRNARENETQPAINVPESIDESATWLNVVVLLDAKSYPLNVNAGHAIAEIIDHVQQLRRKNNLDMALDCQLHSRRLDCKLCSTERIGDHVMDQDVLVACVENRRDSSIKNWTVKHPPMSTGMFTVRVLEAKIDVPGIAIHQTCIVARLLPYSKIGTTKVSTGSHPTWKAAVFQFPHTRGDSSLKLQLQVFQDPPLLARKLLGSYTMDFSENMQKLHCSEAMWHNAYSLEGFKKCIGSINFSIKFEPDPDDNGHIEDEDTLNDCTTNASSGNKTETSKAKANNVRGTARLLLKQMHVCTNKCSSTDGHMPNKIVGKSISARIWFQDTTQDIDWASDCLESLQFAEDFQFNSYTSKLKIEILMQEPKTLSNPMKEQSVGTMSISIFEAMEHQTDCWTDDTLPNALGPNAQIPDLGTWWQPLRHEDDQVGCVLLSFIVKEDFSSLIQEELHKDVFRLEPEEMHFDLTILRRNLDRASDIIKLFEQINHYVAVILNWRYPFRTLLCYFTLVICALYFPVELIPSSIFICFCIITTFLYVYRVRGHFRNDYITHDPKTPDSIFRPVANLMLAPISATGLKPTYASSDTRTDPYVRIYFEPNAGKEAQYLIVQTEAVHATLNPVWGGVEHSPDKTKSVTTSHRAWIRDKINHLSRHDQDSIFHDVIEPWDRPDGGTDRHAYKYPILQSTEIIDGLSVLKPWQNSDAAIRFDVLNGGPSSPKNDELGHLRVLLKDLVGPTSDTVGGEQPEFEFSRPLSPPSGKLSSKSNLVKESGTLRVRMQLILREFAKPITLKDWILQDAMSKITEKSNEKGNSMFSKYKRMKELAIDVQNGIGTVCSFIERVESALMWVHPKKSWILLFGFLCMAIVLALVPLRYLLVYQISKKFTSKFHQIIDTDLQRALNFLSSFPNRVQLREVFYWKNREYLNRVHYEKARTNLHAQWAATIWKKGEGIFSTWQERYAVIRNSKLEYWNNLEDAEMGDPPKSYIQMSSVVEEALESEKKHAPKDSLCIAVFDVKHLVPGEASIGHRRLLALRNENELQRFVKIVRQLGELETQ